MKKIAHTLLVTAMAGGLALASATGASAAHCNGSEDPAAAPPGPGFSYFGTVHAQASTNAEGGPDSAHNGASSCIGDTGNPSDRAPGKKE